MNKKIERKKPCKHHGILKPKDVGIKKQRYNGEVYDYTICLICFRERNLLKKEANDKNKTCINCKKILSDNFYTKSELTKKYRICRICKKISTQNRKEYNKNYYLFKKFKITIDEYNLMLEKQNGVCFICLKKESVINKISGEHLSLAVDHYHPSGQIRGLLCRHCNLMIGSAKESRETLLSAIKYLDFFDAELKKEIDK